MMNKKAQTFNIYTFIVVSLLAVVLFAGLIYVMGLVNSVMQEVGIANEVNAGQAGYSNMTLAAELTFGQVNDGIQALRLVALTLIMSLAISIIIANGFVKTNPIFFIPYVFIVFLGVILSAPVANAYEILLESDIFDGTLATFTGSNWIILHLPLVVLVVGVLGGIFMFINLVRTGNEGDLR